MPLSGAVICPLRHFGACCSRQGSVVARPLPHTLPGAWYVLQHCHDMEGWADVTEAGARFWGDGAARAIERSYTGERHFYRFRVERPDSDYDGVEDFTENQLGTDPFQWDTDGDGYPDGVEYGAGSDPLQAASLPGAATDRFSDGGRETGLVEQPLNVWVQDKYVRNDWSRQVTTTTTTEGGSVVWGDADTGSHSETYETYAPRWEQKWGLLNFTQQTPSAAYPHGWVIYPPEGVPSAYARWDYLETGEPGYQSWWNEVRLRHAMVMLRSETPQPWDVRRRFLHSRVRRDDQGVVVDEQNLGVKQLMISMSHQDGASSHTLDGLTSVQGEDTTDYLAPLRIAGYAGYGFDDSNDPPWLMVPQNGTGTVFAYTCAGTTGRPVHLRTAVGAPFTAEHVATSDFQILNYTTSSTSSTTHVNAGVGEPNVEYDNNYPVLKLMACKYYTLKVTVIPVRLVNGQGVVVGDVAHLPTAEDLKYYLDNVFRLQANIETQVTMRDPVNVNYDVGIDTTGEPNTIGAFDCIGMQDTQITYSDSAEAKAVLHAAPPDDDAHVVVYYLGVANPVNGPFLNAWKREEGPNGSEGPWILERPLLGLAQCIRATFSNHRSNPANPIRNWVWVANLAPGARQASSVEWVIAHEIGHFIGNLKHSQIQAGLGTDHDMFVTKDSDLEMRLMTGKVGPKRAAGSTALVRQEWLELQYFFSGILQE